MNLRANLKRLQMAKDGTICASLKITSAMNWIILSMFKLISSQWFFKPTKKPQLEEAGEPTHYCENY